MRILMAGDTHGDLKHMRYLFAVAQEQNCDRIFVLGDFGYWEHELEGQHFLDRVDLNANLKNIPVYFLDGNHDNTSLLLEKYSQAVDEEGFLLVRPYVRYARRGHEWSWDHARYIALGGAYSVDKEWRLERERKRGKPGSYWFPEEEMTNEEMDNILANCQGVDVILAHDKPLNAKPDWDRKTFPECMPNQGRLQQAVDQLKPTFYFHGHLHYRYSNEIQTAGWSTWVEGLDCNQEANSSGAPITDSWTVFDVNDI